MRQKPFVLFGLKPRHAVGLMLLQHHLLHRDDVDFLRIEILSRAALRP